MAPRSAALLEDDELPDLRAVELCLAGDPHAFSAVVERHAPAVHALCMRMVGNRAVAEELAQEAFAKAYGGLGGFRGEARLRHWLLRIALNLCRDFLKAGERRESAEELVDEDEPATTAPGPERIAEGRQAVAALEAAILKLPATYREAFLLRHVEELSYEEIQGVIGGNLSMLKVRVFRAREQLRKLLAGDDEQEKP